MGKGEAPPFQHLPGDVALDIFSRLPPTSVGSLRCVCKSWRTLLNDPSFIGLHHTRAIRNPGYLLRLAVESNLHFMEDVLGNETGAPRIYPIRRNGCHNVIASCNGLVLHSSCQLDRAMYVCNPFTAEHVKLAPVRTPSAWEDGFGLGLEPTTGVYKVARMFRRCHHYTQELTFGCELHTLGTDTWRYAGDFPFRPRGAPVFLNGALHWKKLTTNHTPTDEAVLSLDLRREKFTVRPAPRVRVELGDQRYIALLGDELAFVLDSLERIEIWILDDESKNTWCKRYSFAAEYRWGNCEGPRFELVGLWKRNGELLGKSGTGLGYYDPESKSLTRVGLPCNDELRPNKVLMHVASLVSPKSLCRLH